MKLATCVSVVNGILPILGTVAPAMAGSPAMMTPPPDPAPTSSTQITQIGDAEISSSSRHRLPEITRSNGASKMVMALGVVIPPGREGTCVVWPKRGAFRPDRVVVSPESFPVPVARRAWTWPAVAAGRILARAHRALARALRVDPHAPRERRVYLAPGQLSYEADPELEVQIDDEDEEPDGSVRRFVTVPVQRSRSERALDLIGHAARALSQTRLRWQEQHLAKVVISEIRIGGTPQLAGAGAVPVSLLNSASAGESFLSLQTCATGSDICVSVVNGSTRTCELKMAMIGIAR